MKIYLFSALLYFSFLTQISALPASTRGTNFWLKYSANNSRLQFPLCSSLPLDVFFTANTQNYLRVNSCYSVDNRTVFFSLNGGDSHVGPSRSNHDKAPSAAAALINVDFETPDYCVSDGIAVFSNKTINSGGGNLTYLWNFGDNLAGSQDPNTSTEIDGKHVYHFIGVYEVTLTVTSDDGSVVTLKKQFRVNGDLPKAGFEVLDQNKLCSYNMVEFKDEATVDFGEVTKIEWYFDFANKNTPDVVDVNPTSRDGLPKIYSFKYPTFNDVESKTYIVKMKVYSGQSCADEQVKTITVYGTPVADFSLQSSCLTDGVAKFSTYALPDANLAYLWDFGDLNATEQNPNVSNLKDPDHRYTVAGKYNVKLVVTNPAGCQLVLNKEITIDGAQPIADFEILNPSALCAQSAVTILDKTTLAFGEVTKLELYYDFDNDPSVVEVDYSPGSGINRKRYTHQYPSFSFPSTKIFVIKMVAYVGNTCVSSVEKSITINATPVIEFPSINEICSEAPDVQLFAQEINEIPGFGVFTGPGLSSSGMFSPSVAGPGLHDLTYTFTSQAGCVAQKTIQVTVQPTPVVNAGQDKVIFEGEQFRFNATASGAQNLIYKWSPSTGLDRDDVLNPLVKATEDMIYTLTVQSDKGCLKSDDVYVKVLGHPSIPSAISPNGDAINDVWNIKQLEKYTFVKVSIYDRAGERIFESSGYKVPFDGTYNGKPLPVGVYYYVIILSGYDKPITGTLTIIK
ncbi:PKD domain-containing protein [Pedobacter sp.]